MNLRVSSSLADPAPQRWYREPWPWLLMSGPFVVVVASLASAWIAVKSEDGLVAEDYYKQGLLINRRLAVAPPDRGGEMGATVTVDVGGRVRARLYGLTRPPSSLRLTLGHPDGRADQVVTLVPGPDGDYAGTLQAQTLGRWIVTLESDTWRLPVTTVAGQLSEIHLGSSAGHS
jgi:hypothetical protein